MSFKPKKDRFDAGEWSQAWSGRYGAPGSTPARRRSPARRLPSLMVSSLVLALGISSLAIAQSDGEGGATAAQDAQPKKTTKSVKGTKARFTGDSTRYVELARNTRAGDGGATADVCTSNAPNEACLNMVNKGNGVAASFRTRGLTGFRLQTSGQGQATPFDLDSNATGKVEFLNSDQVDGKGANDITSWGIVRYNGGGSVTLLDKKYGADSAARLGTGTYSMRFTRDVSACSFQATAGNYGGAGVDPAQNAVVATASLDGSDSTRAYVTTYDASVAGSPKADTDVQVAANC